MMHRSRVGSDIPLDQMYGNPAVTKWRQLEDVSLYNDLTYRQEVITIPHETEELAAEFFDELKPVFYSMKILGLFPLQRRNPSEPFRRCILSLLYSILFYFAMNLYAYHVSRVRIEFITSSEASFDELMYSVVHFLYVMPHFYVIPCHWKEVTKVGRYFNLWSDFQKQFFTVTGKQLYLGQKRRARICVVLIPVLALLFVLIEFFMSSANEQIWELGFYWYIFVMILQHVAWWWLVCSCLRGAIASLSTNFFKLSFSSDGRSCSFPGTVPTVPVPKKYYVPNNSSEITVTSGDESESLSRSNERYSTLPLHHAAHTEHS
ncbi:hypothetical protein ANN_21251 [Periplaneta americana]|uniref:Gustatory receptor n=1 Tax=Periplaneta americana TaxID=6978 RepID=A0ABQ8SET8_PERAM|nr:hypothetical protein ANN_21251 [Periplaneta americana]